MLTLTYRMPSMLIDTLSFVMALCKISDEDNSQPGMTMRCTVILSAPHATHWLLSSIEQRYETLQLAWCGMGIATSFRLQIAQEAM